MSDPQVTIQILIVIAQREKKKLFVNPYYGGTLGSVDRLV